MTIDEYIDYTKCREASFTYQNATKFKNWLNLIAYHHETYSIQVADSLIDVLGYLSWEMVGLVTLTSLIVRRNMLLLPVHDEREENIGIATGVMTPELRLSLSTVPIHVKDALMVAQVKPSAIEIGHVMEAIRRYASNKLKFLTV